MTRFNKCPNCGHKPSGGLFGGSWMKIYECTHRDEKTGKTCETHYCYRCGGDRCPNCGSKERRVAGECFAS